MKTPHETTASTSSNERVAPILPPRGFDVLADVDLDDVVPASRRPTAPPPAE